MTQPHEIVLNARKDKEHFQFHTQGGDKMKTVEEICEIIVVKMADLVTEEKAPAHIREGDIIYFIPKDGTLGFQRPNVEEVDFLFFGGSYDSKIYFEELREKLMCIEVAGELARRMGFHVKKVADREDILLSYQFLKV
ncbi:hypothetical protein HY250_01905 [Candidatus Azambacteria bacterium]|nr:hypothetical protein [Candidatus Azambacteria bacterium]